MISGYLKAYVLYPFFEGIEKRGIRSKLRTIKMDAGISFNQRVRARRKALTHILSSAGTGVPYYRDLFKEINFNPDNVNKDIAYLGELPYLTKEIIREQGERLIDESYKKEALHLRKTGASTGPSTLIYYSREAVDWTAAVNLFVNEWMGKKRHMKEVHLSTRFPEKFPLKDRIRERIKCMSMNRVNIVSDSFDPGSLEKIWNELKGVRPYSVQAHPSTLYALALFVKEREEPGDGTIRVFESTGEILDEKKRRTIEEVFNCKVFNRYGNAEFGVIACDSEDPDAGLRVADFMVWPETLELEGGTREIVLTGLTNDAMPLLRYRTGDLGELEVGEDAFYLKNLKGRVHDIVRIGEKGYPTHYIQDLLDRIAGIEEFQVEVRKGLPLLLRLIASDAAKRGAIRESIRGWWGDKVEIEFSDFDGLKRVGWRDKFSYLVDNTTNEGSP